MNKTKVLEELLTEKISEFSRRWIEESDADEEDIRKNYKLLKSYGLTDSKITSRAELLGRDPETLERNYQKLREMGLADSKIATLAHLLGRDPETLERTWLFSATTKNKKLFFSGFLWSSGIPRLKKAWLTLLKRGRL